jgi:ferredoxin-NADP reductase
VEPLHKREVFLESNRVLGPALHLLTFRIAPDEAFTFAPGQYITFFLTREGKSITRSYSFFSPAGKVDRFDLLVKEVPGGYGSTFLCRLPADSHPRLTGLAPLGRFFLNDPSGRDVVLVATGTGLAPFVPMLDELRARFPQTPTYLIFGNRHREEVVYLDELRELERAWPSFHFLPILSQPPADGSWPYAVGHVEDTLAARFPHLSSADVYVCGVPAMVNEVQALALRLGCPKDRVFVERY